MNIKKQLYNYIYNKNTNDVFMGFYINYILNNKPNNNDYWDNELYKLIKDLFNCDKNQTLINKETFENIVNGYNLVNYRNDKSGKLRRIIFNFERVKYNINCLIKDRSFIDAIIEINIFLRDIEVLEKNTNEMYSDYMKKIIFENIYNYKLFFLKYKKILLNSDKYCFNEEKGEYEL